VTVEAIVRALLREDPYFLTPDREEDVQLVEIALRRAQWKTPGRQPTEALMDMVRFELERLTIALPVTPKALPPPSPTVGLRMIEDVYS
jgi:hypothetical protein